MKTAERVLKGSWLILKWSDAQRVKEKGFFHCLDPGNFVIRILCGGLRKMSLSVTSAGIFLISLGGFYARLVGTTYVFSVLISA